MWKVETVLMNLVNIQPEWRCCLVSLSYIQQTSREVRILQEDLLNKNNTNQYVMIWTFSASPSGKRLKFRDGSEHCQESMPREKTESLMV